MENENSDTCKYLWHEGMQII